MKDNFGRKLYSLGEFYKITYLAFFSTYDLLYAKKNELLSQHFLERIMLAVTEVNGCEVCSYAHTKMALEAGMSNEEIQSMLAGISDDVPEEEMSAVVFGQHYADSRGYPSKESWERIIEIYGLREAKGILASIRIMMLGNAAGIPWGSFVNRFKGKPDNRSSLPYEIGMILCTIIYLPIALIHALLAKLFNRSTIKFKIV
ncbi:carboxymuconolactone decarboxylase family protein [Methanococcoides burtonii]|uniref:Carboxymuconolactone decarboxylase family protein n=1 Tax=Methanococcoides burtonii (strain DSM 6242 / NBRC 107633 / OCM 468 / ACE-M) TaxID=259564 RepID=Q12YT0_METBU|nr:carboxymuconolactone decarboxylase family protein [Methanococcoides burtonii]ABE51396.1 Carboxymuconolactone decarboxylase family protein [Methanococcoides burtonii DSM 6242]